MTIFNSPELVAMNEKGKQCLWPLFLKNKCDHNSSSSSSSRKDFRIDQVRLRAWELIL